MKKIVLSVCLLLAGAGGILQAAESHADEVIATVLARVEKLKAACPEAVPMAFWDFDGTLICGDISEGRFENDDEQNGRKIYKGLVEETICAGLSPVYRGAAGWTQYHDKDYPRMNEIGRWLAWPYNAQIFAGTRAAELDAFCTKKVNDVYRHHYFATSVKILKALEKAGVENYIVSASPEIFVRNTATSLGLPRERARGIRVAIDGGRMTTRIIYPIPMGEGKIENVREIVLARPNGVAVAGFGNSYSTDGNFLRYIVTQYLPGGVKGFALMINGGKEPSGFEGLFKLVKQTQLVSEQN